MRISVITPSYNSGRFIEATLESVLSQATRAGLEVEYIVVDGGSTDDTRSILERHRTAFTHLIVEPDHGPASAINKGMRLATGDILAWLNADDRYLPGALLRVADAFANKPNRALCFGRCRIVGEQGREIRRGITHFKDSLFPFSCRPLIQTINYVSQPALFFSRRAWQQTGELRENMQAAFDYEFLLRLWRQGGGMHLAGEPLAEFRWHPGLISGQTFEQQFREEWEAAAEDAGRYSPQVLIHALVRRGIVAIYRHMARKRRATASQSS